MNTINHGFLLLVMIILISALTVRVDAIITGKVLNEINTEGRPVKIHCLSDSGQDLGYHDLKYTEEYSWEFQSAFWMDTKYTCHVLMEDDIWYFFDAYDEHRDYKRCVWSCKWIIRPHLILLGYNEENGSWEQFPFSAFEITANVTSFISESPSPAPH